MDARITEIRPLVADGWARHEQMGNQSQEARQIKPVPKGEGSGLGRLRQEHKQPQDLRESREKEKKEPIERDVLEEMVQDVDHYLADMRVNLNFRLHDDTGDMVLQVVSAETGEVIRQLPPDEILELRAKLEDLRGLLFESKV